MSVLWAGNMSGPRVQRHVFGQLLLLLLLSGRTRTVFCQEDEEVTPKDEIQVEEKEAEEEGAGEEEPTESPETTPIPTENTEVNEEEHGSGRSFDIGVVPDSTIETISDSEGTPSPEEEGQYLLLYVIPGVLVVLIIAIILCCIFIHRRINSNTMQSEFSKEDPFLDGSSTEKVPMPMFEEDVPSVLELEMEDLDDWIKKDGEHNQKA